MNRKIMGVTVGTPTSPSKVASAITPAEIGAAPAGYGLGTTSPKEITGISALDSATNNGWYYATGIGSTLGGVYVNHALFFVSSKDAYHVKQTIFPVDSNTIIFRSNDASGWGAYECLNPPMQLGVEYRTTERWKGNAVYVQIFDCGELPNSSIKNTELPIGGCFIVDISAIATNDDGVYKLPALNEHSSSNKISFWNVARYMNVETFGNGWGGYKMYVTVKYTK